MKISKDEQLAIKAVLEAGNLYGYGNMISHLQTAWARMLVKHHYFSEEIARKVAASDGKGYPFAMQDDIVERGFFDETGESYRKGA